MTESGSIRHTLNGGIITAVQSGSAAVRLREARSFLNQFEPGAEVLLLGASRGSVDDLARTISLEKGGTFGLHRLSFTELAARLAIMELAARDRAQCARELLLADRLGQDRRGQDRSGRPPGTDPRQ